MRAPGRNEVAPPQRNAIEAVLLSGFVDQPFDHVDDLRSSGAAVGCGAHRGGENRARADVGRGNTVPGRGQAHAFDQRDVRRAVSADIAEVFGAQREKAAGGIEREFGRDGEIAAHIVADKRLVAFARPFNWTPDTARAPGDEREFGEKRVACAEIAADLAGDDAHGFHGHVKDRRELAFLAHNAARAGVKCVASGRSVIDADSGARLHRYAGDAVDPCVEPCDMGGPRKRVCGRGDVANLGVDDDIRQGIVEPRRTGLDRGCRLGHGW